MSCSMRGALPEISSHREMCFRSRIKFSQWPCTNQPCPLQAFPAVIKDMGSVHIPANSSSISVIPEAYSSLTVAEPPCPPVHRTAPGVSSSDIENSMLLGGTASRFSVPILYAANCSVLCIPFSRRNLNGSLYRSKLHKLLLKMRRHTGRIVPLSNLAEQIQIPDIQRREARRFACWPIHRSDTEEGAGQHRRVLAGKV